jgi:hypothetical protein
MLEVAEADSQFLKLKNFSENASGRDPRPVGKLFNLRDASLSHHIEPV